MNWTRLLVRFGHSLATLGHLRHRLILEAPQAIADGAGGATQSFAPVVTLWAGILPLLAEVTTAPQQTGETLTHHIAIRYRDGIKIGMRFRQGTDRYVIKRLVDPDALKVRLVCLCTQEHV